MILTGKKFFAQSKGILSLSMLDPFVIRYVRFRIRSEMFEYATF